MSNALSPGDSAVFNFATPVSFQQMREELKAARAHLDKVSIEYAKAQQQVVDTTKKLNNALKLSGD